MELWTEEKFTQVAVRTKLSTRTLSACKDVLVNGLSGVEAAEKVKMLPTQVSRGLSALRALQPEVVNLSKAKQLEEAQLVLKSSVVRSARRIAGENLTVQDPQPGCVYEGVGIVKENGFFVQRIGHIGVIHDVGLLTKVPDVAAHMVIKYPTGGGLASVEHAIGIKGRPEVER